MKRVAQIVLFIGISLYCIPVFLVLLIPSLWEWDFKYVSCFADKIEEYFNLKFPFNE